MNQFAYLGLLKSILSSCCYLDFTVIATIALILTFLFQIRNNGPSKIRHMKVLIHIPISYLVPNTQSRILLVEYNNITINATHNNRTINAVFTQNNTVIIQNAMEISSTPQIVENMQGMDFDSSKVGYPVEFDPGNQPDSSETDLSNNFSNSKRRRRATGDIPDIEYDQLTRWDNTITEIRESLSSLVSIDKTVMFNCHNPADALCIEASLDVTNLEAGDNVVSILISYNVDLNQIDKILTETKDYFVITTLIDVTKLDDEEG